MARHSTQELLEILNSMETQEELKGFTLASDEADMAVSFADFFQEILKERGISAGEAIRTANIYRTYGYQILNGQRKPGRDKVIALCLALTLSFEETQRALKIADEAVLYPRRQRDSILIFCVQQKLTVSETNELLFEMGESPLA